MLSRRDAMKALVGGMASLPSLPDFFEWLARPKKAYSFPRDLEHVFVTPKLLFYNSITIPQDVIESHCGDYAAFMQAIEFEVKAAYQDEQMFFGRRTAWEQIGTPSVN